MKKLTRSTFEKREARVEELGRKASTAWKGLVTAEKAIAEESSRVVPEHELKRIRVQPSEDISPPRWWRKGLAVVLLILSIGPILLWKADSPVVASVNGQGGNGVHSGTWRGRTTDVGPLSE